MILMGAVATALTLVLDGCKKETAGIDLELNKESIDLKIGGDLQSEGDESAWRQNPLGERR